MLLSVVTDTVVIHKLHKDFEKLMKSHTNGKLVDINLTTRGGAWQSYAYYNEGYDIWWSNERFSKKNKYYNLIGIHPNFNSANRILIQLNYQKEFKDFRDAALWVKDERGKFYLLHSGKMGGGVKGITIENIDILYSGSRSTLFWKQKEFEYYTVCELYSPRAYMQVVAFIKQIKDIKEQLNFGNELAKYRSKGSKRAVFNKYTPEFWGKRKSYYVNRKVTSTSDHGLIVESLKLELENKFGCQNKIVKNKYVDLGIAIKNKPIAIFEIKTDVLMQMIYSAVGQLTLHAFASKTSPQKYFVVPDTLEESIDEDLNSLGIKTIKFNWQNNRPNFLNLQDFFNAR